jgi:predicted SprT family Zn-dependent metalloprotease
LNNGGATTGYAVLCTIKNNKNGKTKNIYWQYRTTKAYMEWINDDNIKINGIILNVKKETYDYRRN